MIVRMRSPPQHSESSDDEQRGRSATSPAEKMVWSGASKWPDGTARPAGEGDGRPRPVEGSPQVQDVLPGYTLPVHRHDRAVDFRDTETASLSSVRGKHIVGFCIGCTVGATFGAAVGSTLAIGGTVAGAVLGAIACGLVLGLIGVLLSFTVRQNDEENYWRREYPNRPYYNPDHDFLRDMMPAYEYGYSFRMRESQSSFEQVERAMQYLWQSRRGESKLTWEQARAAVYDAWKRHDQKQSQLNARPESY